MILAVISSFIAGCIIGMLFLTQLRFARIYALLSVWEVVVYDNDGKELPPEMHSFMDAINICRLQLRSALGLDPLSKRDKKIMEIEYNAHRKSEEDQRVKDKDQSDQTDDELEQDRGTTSTDGDTTPGETT